MYELLQDILASFHLEIETGNPAPRRHHLTGNAGDEQKPVNDTNGEIQVRVTKYREQVTISNVLKLGLQLDLMI